ncbi:thermonuclease family protein [Mycoplasma enhydrae]|uniref:thermonuclease family protein n=1 Tax=Mycoplasma enhydrae TaxID=2499220 RepID=UPI00197C899A|nr:thermonuclease family protein [Mycoplasma enhydrae]MBN4089291.1 thermonuclease family protein [Mycoplasma enhydrae]MCV3733549.1 thermonuclease family protein [Mycoplasma enhydrae]MCV3753475.1 thermonuclease family protein [Mycoplasma enhydrae]
MKKIKFKWLLAALSPVVLISPLVSIKCQDDTKQSNGNNENTSPSLDTKNKKLILNNKEYVISDNLSPNHATQVKLIGEKDGDTTNFRIINTSIEFICRYAGIDTPETRKRINDNWVPTEGEQFKYGQMAKNFVSKQLKNAKSIWVIPQRTKVKGKDKLSNNFRDLYDRVIGIVVIVTKNNELLCLNEQLVFNGFAKMNYISLDLKNKFYTDNENYYHFLKKAQDKAREDKKGIWSGNINKIYPKN